MGFKAVSAPPPPRLRTPYKELYGLRVNFFPSPRRGPAQSLRCLPAIDTSVGGGSVFLRLPRGRPPHVAPTSSSRQAGYLANLETLTTKQPAGGSSALPLKQLELIDPTNCA